MRTHARTHKYMYYMLSLFCCSLFIVGHILESGVTVIRGGVGLLADGGGLEVLVFITSAAA